MKYCISTLIIFVYVLTGWSKGFITDVVFGCDSLIVNFNDTTTGAISWKWYFGNGDSATIKNPQVKYLYAGKYSVMLIINATDTVYKSNLITVKSVPPASFQYNDTVTIASFTISFSAFPVKTATEQYQYKWAFGDNTFKTDTLPVIEHQYLKAGTYIVTLTVTDKTGCTSVYSNKIEVTDKFVVPNVFSPNGDGVNDIFKIESNGVTPISIRIYSGSGVLVFERKSPVIIWDGHSSSGQELKPGIYYYELEVETGQKKNGFIYLFK